MAEVRGWLPEMIVELLGGQWKKDQRLAKPYPHGFVDPLLGKGQKTRLATGLASGERRAREAGIDPKYWRGMLGVMNIWNKRTPSPLGADMDFKDMLDDMVGLYSGKGKINMEEALKAWSRTQFDPEGKGYDYESARKYGIRPTGNPPHWPSRVPETGLILKGRGHKTWDLTAAEEKELGYKIIKKDNRYYSTK